MAADQADAESTALVPGAHRVIRMLDAGEGPFAGALVTRGDSVAVRMDAEELGGWDGWAHAGSEHVAGPLDLIRRTDGHDALLPWCTERVTAFLGRRAAAGAELGAGEAGTLVVSLLRGLSELAECGTEPCDGDWWLTDDGRPLFALGAGKDARASAREVVERLRDGQPDRAMARLLAPVSEGLQQNAGRPRMPRAQLERWEQELLAVAAPRPLRRDLHAPERVRDIEMTRLTASGAALSRRDARAARSTEVEPLIDRMRGLLVRSRNAAGSVLRAARERGAEPAERRRPRSAAPRAGWGAAASSRPAPGRRRMLIVAGAAAAAVLAGGLLWPGGATGDPDESAPAPAATPLDAGPAPSDGPAEAAVEKTPSAADDDPVAAAEGLLDALAACARASDAACAGAVAAGSAGIVEALDDVLADDAGRTVEIVDEYGDVAVIRLSSGGSDAASGEQMMVLVRQDEKWLVRDVYGVADQPG